MIYPVLDLTGTGEGMTTYDGIGMKIDDLHLCARTYLGGDGDRRDPLASPLLAPSLNGLPRAFVLTVEHDALRAEGQRYAVRLEEARVPTTALDVE